ncbi:hypothetical protein JBE27_53030, partial [Streptomyces albiflaviniger]|nr:hypothetical protein [Streptomyces albiflaviniger]
TGPAAGDAAPAPAPPTHAQTAPKARDGAAPNRAPLEADPGPDRFADDALPFEQLVQGRLDRKAIFDRKPRALIHVILEEAALRRQIGGPEVMSRQYEHLVECAARPGVSIQVMPMNQAEHAGLRGPFTVIETPEDTSLVYTESHGESILVSKPDKVAALTRRYAMIRTQALGPKESVSFIEQLMG